MREHGQTQQIQTQEFTMSDNTFNTFRIDTTPETFMVGQRHYNWKDVSNDPMPANIFIDDTIADVTYQDENGETKIIENLATRYTQDERREFTKNFECIRGDFSSMCFPYAKMPALGDECSFGRWGNINCRPVGGDYQSNGPEGVVESLYNGKYFEPYNVSVEFILATGTPEAASDFFGYVMAYQDDFWQKTPVAEDAEQVSKSYEMLAQAANYWIHVGSEESSYYEDAVELAVGLITETSILPTQRYKWFCSDFFYTDRDGITKTSDPYVAALQKPLDSRLAEAIAALLEEMNFDDKTEPREFNIAGYYKVHYNEVAEATQSYYDYDRGATLTEALEQSIYLNDPTILGAAKLIVDQRIAAGSDHEMASAISWLASQGEPRYQADFEIAVARAEAIGNVEALTKAHDYAVDFAAADDTQVRVSNKLVVLSCDHQDKERALAAAKALIAIGNKSEGFAALKKLADLSEVSVASFEAAVELWKSKALSKYKPEIYGYQGAVDVSQLPPATSVDRNIFLKCLWHPQAYGDDWDFHGADGLDWKPLTDFRPGYVKTCGKMLMSWLTHGMDAHEKLAFETRVEKILAIYGLSLF